MHRAATGEESRTHGWSKYDERELQQKSTSLEKHATWQTMDLSSSPSIYAINTMATTSTSKFINHCSILKPKRGNHSKLEDEIREVQTLQLFPLCSDVYCDGVIGTKKDRKLPIKTINTNFTPNQFFEFLPLKN